MLPAAMLPYQVGDVSIRRHVGLMDPLGGDPGPVSMAWSGLPGLPIGIYLLILSAAGDVFL